MTQISIYGGTANGWTDEQNRIMDEIITLMRADKTTKSSSELIGTCWRKTTMENASFKLTFDADSSD